MKTSLTQQDILALSKSFITPDLISRAMLFRVDSANGARLIGRNGQADYAGIVFPYYWPGESTPREYRLRRDHPEFEQKLEGMLKEKNKYLSPPGGANLLYFMPDTLPEWLSDPNLDTAFAEGEKKAIALARLACHERGGLRPRFLPIGIPGVWNWRGTIGKTNDEKGERRDVKGPIPDLDRIEWNRRTAYIIFDTNVATNKNVRAARRELSKELTRRGARVRLVDLPQIEGVNGVDDLLAITGPEFVLSLISSSNDQVSEGGLETAHSYFQKEGRLVRFKPTRDGDIVVPLCNFTARIIGDITEDDGSTERRVYEIQGQLADRHLQATATVSADEFSSLKWIDGLLGASATIYAGQSEHVRCAVKLLSDEIEETRIYTHTGWREVDGQWFYLHGGGAIGQKGNHADIAVRLPNMLSNLTLPDPPINDELITAVRHTLNVGDIANTQLTFPLFGACWAAVLGDCDFSLHIAGDTGSAKSEIAAIAYASATAAFIQWLAPRYAEVQAGGRERVSALRDEVAARFTGHKRHATTTAKLLYAWEVFLTFAQEVGAVSEHEQLSLIEQVRHILPKVAAKQEAHQLSQDPATRFIELVIAALNTGMAHLASMTDGEPVSKSNVFGWRKGERQGKLIGWTDCKFVHLQPDAAFSLASELSNRTGNVLTLTQTTLWKRLNEHGLLIREDGRETLNQGSQSMGDGSVSPHLWRTFF